MDKKFFVYIAAPVIVSLILIIASSRIRFKPSLSPAEQKASGFSFERSRIVLRPLVVAPTVQSPIEIRPIIARKEFPKIPLSKLAPQPNAGEDRKLSMVLIKNGRKIAILNGIVVKEGDIIDRSVVKKIESSRVLIVTGKEEKWIKIE